MFNSAQLEIVEVERKTEQYTNTNMKFKMIIDSISKDEYGQSFRLMSLHDFPFLLSTSLLDPIIVVALQACSLVSSDGLVFSSGILSLLLPSSRINVRSGVNRCCD